ITSAAFSACCLESACTVTTQPLRAACVCLLASSFWPNSELKKPLTPSLSLSRTLLPPTLLDEAAGFAISTLSRPICCVLCSFCTAAFSSIPSLKIPITVCRSIVVLCLVLHAEKICQYSDRASPLPTVIFLRRIPPLVLFWY